MEPIKIVICCTISSQMSSLISTLHQLAKLYPIDICQNLVGWKNSSENDFYDKHTSIFSSSEKILVIITESFGENIFTDKRFCRILSKQDNIVTIPDEFIPEIEEIATFKLDGLTKNPNPTASRYVGSISANLSQLIDDMIEESKLSITGKITGSNGSVSELIRLTTEYCCFAKASKECGIITDHELFYSQIKEICEEIVKNVKAHGNYISDIIAYTEALCINMDILAVKLSEFVGSKCKYIYALIYDICDSVLDVLVDRKIKFSDIIEIIDVIYIYSNGELGKFIPKIISVLENKRDMSEKSIELICHLVQEYARPQIMNCELITSVAKIFRNRRMEIGEINAVAAVEYAIQLLIFIDAQSPINTMQGRLIQVIKLDMIMSIVNIISLNEEFDIYNLIQNSKDMTMFERDIMQLIMSL